MSGNAGRYAPSALALTVALGAAAIGSLAIVSTHRTVEAQGGTTVGPTPIDAYTEPSLSTSIDIYIDDIADLYGADVRLSYDPDVIEIVDALPAAGIQIQPESSFLSPDLVLFNQVDDSAGTIWFAVTQISPTLEVAGSGAVASFDVLGLQAGVSPLTVTYQKLVRRDGTTIAATPAHGVVAVGPQAPVLSIEALDLETALLSWTPSLGATSYEVYRDTTFPFEADGSPLATVSTLEYEDSDALGSSESNHVYAVRAVSDSDLRSPPSNVVAEFEYELHSGEGPGDRRNNLVGIPLVTDLITSADTLADHVGPQAYAVLRHVAAAQAIEYWLPGLGIGTDFALPTGASAFVNLDQGAPELLTLTGGVPDVGAVEHVLFRPESGESCTYNFITVPVQRTDVTTAEELGADIGGVYMMLHFDAATQAIVWRVLGLAGTNFPVRAGYPYVACLSADGPAIWP